MEKWLLEAKNLQKVVEKQMNEVIENYSLAENLCADVEKREPKAVIDLLTFQ